MCKSVNQERTLSREKSPQDGDVGDESGSFEVFSEDRSEGSPTKSEKNIEVRGVLKGVFGAGNGGARSGGEGWDQRRREGGGGRDYGYDDRRRRPNDRRNEPCLVFKEEKMKFACGVIVLGVLVAVCSAWPVDGDQVVEVIQLEDVASAQQQQESVDRVKRQFGFGGFGGGYGGYGGYRGHRGHGHGGYYGGYGHGHGGYGHGGYGHGGYGHGHGGYGHGHGHGHHRG
ncbi:hypothetical protein pipiens_009407 [Culex pipiens pipiens]|uniref:Uncharacterized protein n=1 Tax=Culex pipiens pipiens TaxID=38569 RepID=A0ABD1DEM8_CULPP